MPRTFVVNASPLILLARIGRLDLLPSLAEVVLVPAAVLRELTDGRNYDDAAARPLIEELQLKGMRLKLSLMNEALEKGR